ncbi:translation initiation factor IF-2, mitochondrial isoform X1 [Anopheles aquasalis]|uniref:translation initiation factor IF-2, mitochondrial isoform X1 n=1 Tax=Anopheles aquasalis TaxID=42839 RepID=UPI00215B330E|nr:translation initiation factor IF-2, mitochondrial isoform X1 [Anopheles aquasalis]
MLNIAKRLLTNELFSATGYARGSVRLRQIQHSAVWCKRRKTAEEKNAIEFAPKKKNKPQLSGVVDIWRNMTVAELARSCQLELEHVQEVMLYVKGIGSIESQARLEDPRVIKDIASKCGFKTKIVAAPTVEEEVQKDRDVVPRPPPAPENLKDRPPVVTVMGHVDHGKTTLLDSLRGASVAAGEAGGITQHIGAFTVELDNGEKVTFLDTPGHAAFSAMRARGAYLTDIIVLVVAAEDGVMEQTKEVLRLAKEQSVPIIVAINKIDKPGANIERVKKELAQYGLPLEGYGGDTIAVGVSALHGTNLDELTEAVSTQATLMGLKGEYEGPVEGVVVESKVDSHRGKLSTAIVSRGTLRKGAILVSGQAWAKVRGLFDHAGQPILTVTPGMPVEILGWRELPVAGEQILEVESEKMAHSVLRWRANQAMIEKALTDAEAINQKRKEHDDQYKAEREKARLSGYYRRKQQGPRAKESTKDDGTPRVNVIVKGDVHGSVEAILDVLDTYDDNERCRLDVIHYAVGDVNESDVELAQLFDALIYAFSVNVPKKPVPGVSIRPTNIIYRLVDDLKKEINAKLPLVDVEEEVGEANVLQLFDINEGRRKVTVLGCRCTKGLLKKSHKYKLRRNGELLAEGLSLESMRHLKNEVDSIKKDVECGLRLNDQSIELKVGDTIVCYQINKQPQETEWDPGF